MTSVHWIYIPDFNDTEDIEVKECFVDGILYPEEEMKEDYNFHPSRWYHKSNEEKYTELLTKELELNYKL